MNPEENDILGHVHFMIGNTFKSLFEYNSQLVINGEIKNFQAELSQVINVVKADNLLEIQIEDLVLY